MPLRLKFAIRLTLLCSLAIILFSSCGYDGCADDPCLPRFSPRAYLQEARPLL